MSTKSDTQRATGETNSKYLILACDGGGMRGYLSSLILQRLDKEFSILGSGNVDLYAGTSTGGLIALGLAHGTEIASIVNLYQTSGAEIFHPLGVQFSCLGLTADASSMEVNELWQVLFNNTAPDKSLLHVLKHFIPGNPVLSTLPSKVMVATFQLGAAGSPGEPWRSLIIDNFEGSPGAACTLYDAALSTSSAPVYFPPYYNPQFGWCSDGGLFANNPAALAVSRAIAQGQSLSDIALLSIGTGTTPASLSPTPKDRLCFGIDRWVSLTASGNTPPFPLLNAMMDGVSDITDYQCGQLLNGSDPDGRYLRINPYLPKAVALDDYSQPTMEMFQQTASDLFASAEWTSVGTWIQKNFKK